MKETEAYIERIRSAVSICSILILDTIKLTMKFQRGSRIFTAGYLS